MSEQLYERFHIRNATPFPAKGRADYRFPGFCDTDFFDLASSRDFTAERRGACLIISVSATVTLADGTRVEAREFTSAGTALSQFAIVQTAEQEFMIIVTG